jgi:hypothetical protein
LVNLGALLEGPHWEITLTREAALAIKRRGVEMRLVIEYYAVRKAKVDPVLLKEVARAHRCFEALLSGRAASVGAVAALEGIDKSYVSRLLPLAFLSPRHRSGDCTRSPAGPFDREDADPAHCSAPRLAGSERVSASLEAPSTGWHGWAILTPETADREMVR